MRLNLLCVAGSIAFLWFAKASPACAESIEVVYSDILSSGYATDPTGALGMAGSLIGDTAQIALIFNTTSAGSSYTSAPGSSLLVASGVPGINGSPGATVGAAVTVNGEPILFSNYGGSAVDSATAGSMQQSLTQIASCCSAILTQGLVTASVSDPSIPASITQSFTLNNIGLDAYFSESESGPNGFDIYGAITSGSLEVMSPVPSATALPAALPLFATGLGALSLLGWRQQSKTSPSACI